MQALNSQPAAEAQVSVATKDGRVVYLSAVAYGTPAPGLTRALTDACREIASSLSYWELYGGKFRLKVVDYLRERGYNVSSVEVAVSYRCPSCGASIKLSPEAVIYVCPYCGWAGDVLGRTRELLAWRPIQEEEAVEAVLIALGKRARPLETVLKLVPYWVYDVEATAHYRAEVVYRKRRGDKYVRRIGTTEGSVKAHLVYPLVARLNTEFYGDKELEANIIANISTKPPEPLSTEEAKRLAPYVLAPEVSQEEAALLVRDKVEDVMVRKAKVDAMSKFRNAVRASLCEFRCDVKLSNPRLVLAPYWFVTYEWKGSVYASAVSGIDGDVLKMEVPIAPYERALRLAGAWIAAALTGLATELVLRSKEVGGEALILPLIGGAITLAIARSVFAEAKVKR